FFFFSSRRRHTRFDCDWSSDVCSSDLTPIVDLCHFGVPDWMGNFQNPDFPRLFADYAGAFAERFPWVQLYTPINEMFICAVFSRSEERRVGKECGSRGARRCLITMRCV